MSVPNVVYKYRSFARGIELLTQLDAYFASPTDFDDPYDCNWDLERGFLSNEVHEPVQKAMVGHLLRAPTPGVPEITNPGLIQILSVEGKALEHVSGDSRTTLAWDVARRVYQFIAETYYNGAARDDLARGTRVYCTCATPSGVPMWVHYADKCKGVVVGLSTTVLERHWQLRASPVDYVPQLPHPYPPDRVVRAICTGKVIPDVDGSIRRTAVLSKFHHWRYEHEIRFVRTTSTTGSQPIREKIPKEAIVEVHLGCRANAAQFIELATLMNERYREIPLFNVTPSRSDYAMNGEQTDLTAFFRSSG